METTRKYPTNREWTKNIKFNNRWYTLKSVFDNKDEDEDENPSLVFSFDDAIRKKREDAIYLSDGSQVENNASIMKWLRRKRE